MNPEDQKLLQTHKITNSVTPRHPDPVAILTRPETGSGKIDNHQCSVGPCTNAHEAHGLCRTHIPRQRRGRSVDETPVRHYGMRECEVPGCEEPHVAGGYCTGHYQRVRKTGDVRADVPLRRPTDTPGYNTAHQRVRAARGAASQYPCAGCGGPATDWCYDHSDPAELTEPKHGSRYSLNVECYLAPCKSCERRADHQNRLVRGTSC